MMKYDWETSTRTEKVGYRPCCFHDARQPSFPHPSEDSKGNKCIYTSDH